jgi:hypothetical protein
MALKKFNPKMVVMTISGPAGLGIGQVVGVAAGTMIEAVRDNDSFTKEKGATGDTVRIDNCDRGGKITFYLQRQSPTNALLEALVRTDELVGTGVVTVSIVDINNPTSVISGLDGWVLKPADVSIAGGEAGVREWTLDFSVLNF